MKEFNWKLKDYFGICAKTYILIELFNFYIYSDKSAKIILLLIRDKIYSVNI